MWSRKSEKDLNALVLLLMLKFNKTTQTVRYVLNKHNTIYLDIPVTFGLSTIVRDVDKYYENLIL
jgi:hypothetical protein